MDENKENAVEGRTIDFDCVVVSEQETTTTTALKQYVTQTQTYRTV